MDILRASILELPTPAQFIPPPREYLQSDESYFGKGCKIVSALDAGVRAVTEIQERGLENSVQDLKEMSKVYFFRHNEISPQAIRNLVNATDSKYDASYINLQNKCKEWQQEFQNGMMSAGTGDGVKKIWFGMLVEGAVVTSDFQVHLWNLRREKAIHLIGPENETEQEQVVRMEKVAALEASFIDHKARYKDAIVGAIDFAKSCKATSDEQFPNYNTPLYIGYLSGLKLQLAQMDPFNAESYEDEAEITPPLKYYRQKSPSDISRFWDQLWTQDNCISFYLPFARTVAVDQMRRDEDGMADWMRATFIQACHSTWDNVISHRLHNVYVSMSGVPGYDKNKLPIYNKAPYLHIRALYSNTELSSFYDKGVEIVLVPHKAL